MAQPSRPLRLRSHGQASHQALADADSGQQDHRRRGCRSGYPSYTSKGPRSALSQRLRTPAQRRGGTPARVASSNPAKFKPSPRPQVRTRRRSTREQGPCKYLGQVGVDRPGYPLLPLVRHRRPSPDHGRSLAQRATSGDASVAGHADLRPRLGVRLRWDNSGQGRLASRRMHQSRSLVGIDLRPCRPRQSLLRGNRPIPTGLGEPQERDVSGAGASARRIYRPMRQASCAKRSRRVFLTTLPPALRGRASTWRTWRGRL
jgi:hypothetical protein